MHLFSKKRFVLWMILILPELCIFPVNMLLIELSMSRIQLAKGMILSEQQNVLDAEINKMENLVLGIETYSDYLVVKNYDYLYLQTEDERSSHFFHSATSLQSNYEVYLAQNSNVVSIATYFPQTDFLLAKSVYYSEKKLIYHNSIKEILKAEIQLNKDKNKSIKEWIQFCSGEQTYLGKIFGNINGVSVIVISVDQIFEDFSNKDAGYIDYVMLNGEVLKISSEVSEYFGLNIKVNKTTIADGENVWRNQNAKLDYPDLVVGRLVNNQILDSNMPKTLKILIFFAFLSFLLGPIITFIFLQNIGKPLEKLTEGMNRVRDGDESYRIPIRRKHALSEFDQLNNDFNFMLDTLESKTREIYQRKIEEQKLELRYLNQQIRPHFILNALNILYTYEDYELPMIRKMVLYLTKYFRYLVNLNSDYVYLYEEMEFTKNYLDIQKVRYPKRFYYFVEWEEELIEAKIPAVLIQTFVENSIKYGFEKGKMMYIMVLAKIEGKDRIELRIRDTGKGYDEIKLRIIHEFLESRKYNSELGVGIQNIVHRLDILYGTDYKITIDNAKDGGADVRIFLPFIL